MLRTTLFGILVILLSVLGITLLIAVAVLLDSRRNVPLFVDGTHADRTWMSRLHPHTRLIDISIPGSHDTLTYAWKLDTTANSTHDQLLAVVTAHWAETQEFNVYRQLCAGARYFDARIGWRNHQWYGQHGSAVNRRVTYESALAQLRRFAIEHPREVIFWKLRTYDAPNEALHELHHSYLSDILIPTRVDQTLGEIWTDAFHDPRRRGNVMLLTDADVADPYAHDAIIVDAHQAQSVLSSIYSRMQPSPSPNQLLVLQWIAAYDLSRRNMKIVLSVRTVSRRLNEVLLSGRLPDPPRGRRQNVVMIDFLDARLCRAVYSQNRFVSVTNTESSDSRPSRRLV